MEITMKSGDKYSKAVKHHKGTPENPLTDEEIIEKFKDCVAIADKRLPEKNTDEILALVSRLEEVDDVTRIIELCIA